MLGEINRDETGGKITLNRTEKSRFSYLPRPVRSDYKSLLHNPTLRMRPLTASCNRRESDLTSDEHIPGTLLGSKVFHSSLNVSHIRSRICSFDNIQHQPRNSNRKIFHDSASYSHVRATIISPCGSVPKTERLDRIFDQKSDYSHVAPLIAYHDNELHTPGGGSLIIPIQKLNFRDTAKTKIDAKSSYLPKDSEVSIRFQKLNFRDLATSRIDSRRRLDLKEPPKNTQHLIDLLTVSLPDLRIEKATSEIPDRFRISTTPPDPAESSRSQDCKEKDEAPGGLLENES